MIRVAEGESKAGTQRRWGDISQNEGFFLSFQPFVLSFSVKKKKPQTVPKESYTENYNAAKVIKKKW